MLAINPKIKQKAEDIRKKIFGSEVRESLASGLEEMSEDVESIKSRQDAVEQRFQNVIDETTDKDVISAPELIAARNGKPDLKTRIDDLENETNAQLAQTTSQLEDITLNARHHFGMVGDGSDETEKFQNALDSSVGKTLFLPKPQEYYYIGKITIPSNTTLVLDEGIEIVGKPLAQEGFSLLTERLINIIDANNVVIKGNHSTIRLENKSQYTQEWNHIFNIQSSTNVYIYDISANDSGGDGFYVGDQESISRAVPKNINLINCKANNNRRQGLSIVSVDGFYAEKCEFNNSRGTAPETGIDIEPSFPNQKLRNIKFVDCSASGNKTDGVRIHLKASNDSTEGISIEFINFKSKNNAFGYSLREFIGVQGIINFDNCISEENKFAGFVERGNEVLSVKTIYSGCKSINDNVNEVSHTTWQYANGSAFAFMAEKSGQTIGNSHVTNCFVIDNRPIKKIRQGIALYSNPALTDIATNKIYIKNLSVGDGIRYLYEYNQTQRINVSITESESELREFAISSHTGNHRSVYPVDNNRILTNKGATSGIFHRLTRPYDNLIYRFRVDEPQSVVIDTYNFGIIGLPYRSHYKSTKQGSYLVLKGTNEGYYFVVSMFGEWNIVTL